MRLRPMHRIVENGFKTRKRSACTVAFVAVALIPLGFVFMAQGVSFWLVSTVLLLHSGFSGIGLRKHRAEWKRTQEEIQAEQFKKLAACEVLEIHCALKAITVFPDGFIADCGLGQFFACPAFAGYEKTLEHPQFTLTYIPEEDILLRFKPSGHGRPMLLDVEEEIDWISYRPIIFESDPDATASVLLEDLREQMTSQPSPPELELPKSDVMFGSSPGTRGCLLTTLAISSGISLFIVMTERGKYQWIGGGFLLFTSLIFLTVFSPRYKWAARILSASLFVLFGWNFVSELAHYLSGQGRWFAGGSKPDLYQASAGMICFGLPCLWFTVTGGKQS